MINLSIAILKTWHHYYCDLLQFLDFHLRLFRYYWGRYICKNVCLSPQFWLLAVSQRHLSLLHVCQEPSLSESLLHYFLCLGHILLLPNDFVLISVFSLIFRLFL